MPCAESWDVWRSRTSRNSQRGFILFEVLLGAVILVAGIAVVVRSFSGGIEAARLLEQRQLARLRLEEKIVELQRWGIDNPGEARGVFASEEPFAWELRAGPVEGIPQLYQVAVAVRWSAGGVDREMRATLLAPAAEVEELEEPQE